MTLTFSSMIRMRCNECGEHSPNGYNQSPDDWVRQHRERHRHGKCDKCHHWKDDHHLVEDAATADYLKTGQSHCCWFPMGMGDFCGCAGDN